eukprot:TRINITY_DN42421_c0_g1_i1.p1 TRINITY_DN42421_c0_g1~~TRINITY_DN42421_c0_g1_i1.p1  ORF type:complete len:492 (-),score=75.85 TRINITY_DN42421_c0_g1_i1:109-1584(-)
MVELKPFLVLQAYHLNDFRLPEIESIARALHIPFEQDQIDPDQHAFHTIRVPSAADAGRIVARSVLSRAALEVVARGPTIESLESNVRKDINQFREDYCGAGVSFKFVVHSFGCKMNQKLRVEMINKCKWLDNKGDVNLDNPDQIFWLIFDHGPAEGCKKNLEPREVMICRQVGIGARHLCDEFSLKKRDYLGTTSMAADLSFLVANQGKVTPGSTVFDPFAGTGSILISAARMGGICFAGELDGKVVTGKDGFNMRTNFQQYNLENQLGGVIRCDAAHPTWRTGPIFDAIVCDPPYGVRAGARKLGTRGDRSQNAVGTVGYPVPEVLTDLIKFSARTLSMNGRLVYWLPTTTEYVDSDLPTHPCFKIISNSNQGITMRWSRRLITMEKIKPYIDAEVDMTERTRNTEENLAEATAPKEKKARMMEPAHADFAAKVLRDDQRSDVRKGKFKKIWLSQTSNSTKKLYKGKHSAPNDKVQKAIARQTKESESQ